MPFWLTWFFIGSLITGGAAAFHNNNSTTADTNPSQQYTQYTQEFHQQGDRAD